MPEKMISNVGSEIGKLNGVILHRPGTEVENMTPGNAEKALYSDLLNLTIARHEYAQMEGILKKVTSVYYVKDLLTEILKNQKVKENLLNSICSYECKEDILNRLLDLNGEELADVLIEGLVMENDTLTKFMSIERYSLMPLHNFFFTRDASITVNDKVIISRMASKVREREAIIMDAIFNYYNDFSAKVHNPIKESYFDDSIYIEGGDIQ
ncbi:MAG: arginine deiminase family protein, partial [Candidatus Muiribacteriaceae bacterium]